MHHNESVARALVGPLAEAQHAVREELRVLDQQDPRGKVLRHQMSRLRRGPLGLAALNRTLYCRSSTRR